MSHSKHSKKSKTTVIIIIFKNKNAGICTEWFVGLMLFFMPVQITPHMQKFLGILIKNCSIIQNAPSRECVCWEVVSYYNNSYAFKDTCHPTKEC